MRRLPVGLDEVDQAVGGAVVSGDLVVVGEVAFNGLGESFAQLDTPLVEGVNVPDDALSEDLMLVGGDEGTESEGSQLLDHNRVGGAVAGEHLVWYEILELLAFETSLLQLSAHLLFSLSKRERLGLSQKVCQQQFVVDSTGNRVLRLCSRDKVSWDDSGALQNFANSDKRRD